MTSARRPLPPWVRFSVRSTAPCAVVWSLLAVGPMVACGKTSGDAAPTTSDSATASALPVASGPVASTRAGSASVSASAFPSAAPASSSSATPAERFAQNLASARADIASWKCSPNQPIVIKPRVALQTFRCPDDSDLTAFDARSSGGFLLIDGVRDGYAVGRGTQDIEVVKRADGGMLHHVRDGKTDAVYIRYVIWHLAAVPGGYRLGSTNNYDGLFAIVDGAWVQESATPRHPTEGFRWGSDPAPIFAYDDEPLPVCFHVTCPVAETFPLAEHLQTWDGSTYATDLEELAPPYRARLKAARQVLTARLAAAALRAGSGSPSASAAAGPSASSSSSASSSTPAASSSPPAGSASASASAAPASKPASADPRHDDVGACALGTLRAAAEALAYSRLLDEDATASANLAAEGAALVHPGDCPRAQVPSLPTWEELQARLVKSFPPRGLSRKRGAPK